MHNQMARQFAWIGFFYYVGAKVLFLAGSILKGIFATIVSCLSYRVAFAMYRADEA